MRSLLAAAGCPAKPGARQDRAEGSLWRPGLSTCAGLFPFHRAGVDLVGGYQSFLTGAGEMDADPRPARAAELPSRSVELGSAPEVVGLGDLHAVGEGEALRPRSGKAEPHL